MKWRQRTEITNEQVIEIANKLNVNELTARILMNRNLNEDEIRIVINDIHEAILEPSLLTNATLAAKTIASYCRNPKAQIWIFGDYDVDGITAGYIMASALKEVAVKGCDINVYYPERSENYGLSINFCNSLISQSDTTNNDVLVITVDNGITCVEEVKLLKDNGIEVVVTDHHAAKDIVPDCIIVDPHNNNEPDTFKHLAGCGVSFKVAQLVQREFNVYNMDKYVYAVAIGTVADVMPMTLENIAFVKYGLDVINNNKYCPIGIKAYKEYIGKDKFTSSDIAWEIAPRLNACGRMGNVKLASKLFFIDKTENIEDIVFAIEENNSQRKSLSNKAKKFIEKLNIDSGEACCVIDATGFPEGIVGLMANDVLEKYNKPAIVLTSNDNELLKGSARSIEGISLQEILKIEQEKGHIKEYGGHDVAAGITIKKSDLDEFKESINKAITDIVKLSEIAEQKEPDLIIDEVINLNHINEATFELINSIPYDNNLFTAPVFALIDVEVVKHKISSSNDNNICLTIKDETKQMDIWAWGMAKLYKGLNNPKRIHIAGIIERNFINKKCFTMRVIDILKA